MTIPPTGKSGSASSPDDDTPDDSPAADSPADVEPTVAPDTDRTPATAPLPLADDDQAELERLRAEVAQLRAGTGAADTDGPQAPRPSRRIGRRIVAWVLVVLCAVLTLLSVTTRYVRGELLDTDRYVTTVTPLASDPAVQTQIVNSVSQAIDSQINLEQLTADALRALTELTPADRPRLDSAIVGLAPVIAGQANTYIQSAVADFVDSQQFQNLWVEANRRAHTRIVDVLTGRKSRAAVQVADNGEVSIELAPIIEEVKKRLVDRGFTVAERIPQVNKEFVIFEAPDLVRAQTAVRRLDRIATVLPWLAILCAIAAIAVVGSGRRLRMLAAVAIAIAVAMLLLAIGVLVGRWIYLDNVPDEVLAPDAATVLFDTVIHPLRTALRAVAVLALVVALVAYFSGGSRGAVTARALFGRGVQRLSGRRGNRAPTEWESTLWRLRIPIRIGVVAVAALLLIFWRYPTGLVVGWITLITVLVLIAFEFTLGPARPHSGPGQSTTPQPVGDDAEDTGDAEDAIGAEPEPAP
ncbi:hypothetical protein QSJ18_16100 [Gordonia sp. ABSL1-1]|uniref:hypothetical protein n=1 Tax=Gordonia sp. ABSL1-1 TaxID=3053923 RepID=UPI002573BBC2|nr:hypothetical protein [Gordonia sp. ABSL1-1]MDL9938276.1 hypothetical protein [Gordonia sp. ABSL1-1]